MRDFRRGQSVQLEVGRSGTWSARVEAVMPDRLAVATLAPMPFTAAELAGTTLRLSSPTPRGVVRARAVVVAADRTGLLELELTADPDVDQRRDWVRIPVSVPGLIAPRSRAHPPLHTFTLDVSAGGVLVAGAGPADVGAEVEITVKLPDREPLRTTGRIARRTHAGSAGVVFEGLADDEREQLIRWIFERQRLQRRAEREGL
jgi:hypothetical protein